ncbi:MAG: tRNA pseudouridine(55) synthase TruB [Acidobacteria bacterium]|nr:tRNA pseudouridine(55) synthase TruB [Acidobacteriota bacterium]
MKGLLLIDKPAGITSHDVVARLRREVGIRKIGHAGTLDPPATGLMLLLLGPVTRLSRFFLGMDKEYSVRFRLGEESDTLDATGTIVRRLPVDVSAERLQQALASFLGEIEQVPPMFSAKKIGGQKLYRMARRGVSVERAPRRVSIFAVQLVKTALPEAEISLRCSSGTYVRSLVHDLGRMLGCGALVTELRRTATGPFSVSQAVFLGEGKAAYEAVLIPPERLLESIPGRVLCPQEAERIRQGQDLSCAEKDPQGWIRLFDPGGKLIALGQVEKGRIHPCAVLS